MKKIIIIAFLFILLFSVNGCGKKNNILSLEEIKTEFYTDDEIEREIKRINRDDLIKEWGNPDRIIEHENEDVWILNENKVLVVSYNLNNKVIDVDIED